MERLDDVALSKYKMEAHFFSVWDKLLFSSTSIKASYALTSHRKKKKPHIFTFA